MEFIDMDKLQTLAKERTVKTQTIEYDLETLVKKIDKKIIKLNPEYQRNHRWTPSASSKLIESLILNIPIPLIYLSQDIDVDDDVDDDVARYSVIDGQQRLSAIVEFMTNKLKLTGLKSLEDLNGLIYKELPPFLIRRLEERTIKCLRIDSTLDSQVKYDIFERLNSGSVQLEPQELRNAVYRGEFNDMIKRLGKDKLILRLMGIDISKKEASPKIQKMENVEYVLRFFSFYNQGYNLMKKSFKDFLSEQMDRFNQLNKDQLDTMEEHYIMVMDMIFKTMGETPFAKYKKEGGKYIRTSKFHASVYDALTIAVSTNLNENVLSLSQKNIDKFYKLFSNNIFIKSITGSTNDKSKIVKRIEMVKKVLHS